MVVGTLRILPLPGRHGEVLEILQSIQGPVQAQPGCAACQIYEEQGPEGAVVLVERWDSAETLEAHICSEAYRRILVAIELSGGPPEVWFDYVSSSEGMELIERSRNPRPQSAGELEAHAVGTSCHDAADHQTTHRARSRKEVRRASPEGPGGIE
jgi:quinol monooxygenase YgiN